MLKKIETMVMGIGELSLDAISTWFPSKPKEAILKEIEKSELIGVINNQVMSKAKIKLKEDANVVTKSINFAASKESAQGNRNKERKVNVIAKEELHKIDEIEVIDVVDIEEIEEVEEVEAIEKAEERVIVKSQIPVTLKDEISYDELVKLINKYNNSIKEKYNRLVSQNFENQKQAILKYYENRFNVVKNDVYLGKGSEIYSLLHKKTMMEVAYVYIGEVLTEEVFNKISEKFIEDTVYFCITKEADVLPNISNREYYIKDVDSIVESYLSQYKLKEIDYKLLKIN